MAVAASPREMDQQSDSLTSDYFASLGTAVAGSNAPLDVKYEAHKGPKEKHDGHHSPNQYSPGLHAHLAGSFLSVDIPS